MPTITFKAKLQTDVKDFINGQLVQVTRYKVPELTRNHCDMQAFRTHKKFSGLSNSDMFLLMLKRELHNLGIKEFLIIENLPDCVTVEKGKLLDVITIELN